MGQPPARTKQQKQQQKRIAKQERAAIGKRLVLVPVCKATAATRSILMHMRGEQSRTVCDHGNAGLSGGDGVRKTLKF